MAITVAKPPLLDGKKGLIVGIANERSIAWGCAKAFRALGAELAITYVNDKTRSYVEPLAREAGASILMPLNFQIPGQLEQAFPEWLESMRSIYAVYDEAMSSGHRAAALWVVADLFCCNLFGKVRKDPLIQAHIGKHIEVGARHRTNAVRQYDVV